LAQNLQVMSKWSANFQLKRSKIKVTGRQKLQKTGVKFTVSEVTKRNKLYTLKHLLDSPCQVKSLDELV